MKLATLPQTRRVRVTTFTGGLVQTNGYLVETAEGALVIDAPLGIAAHCRRGGIEPTALLLTHQHFDHVEDVAALARDGVPVYAAAPPSPALTLEDGARLMGLPIAIAPYAVDHLFGHERELGLAGLTIELLPVPGHSPDSFVFHVALFKKLFAGDTLFAGSIGRTDLPGGDHQLLLRGIRESLFPLPGATEVLPGHGPPTTIARERAGNPYLA